MEGLNDNNLSDEALTQKFIKLREEYLKAFLDDVDRSEFSEDLLNLMNLIEKDRMNIMPEIQKNEVDESAIEIKMLFLDRRERIDLNNFQNLRDLEKERDDSEISRFEKLAEQDLEMLREDMMLEKEYDYPNYCRDFESEEYDDNEEIISYEQMQKKFSEITDDLMIKVYGSVDFDVRKFGAYDTYDVRIELEPKETEIFQIQIFENLINEEIREEIFAGKKNFFEEITIEEVTKKNVTVKKIGKKKNKKKITPLTNDKIPQQKFSKNKKKFLMKKIQKRIKEIMRKKKKIRRHWLWKKKRRKMSISKFNRIMKVAMINKKVRRKKGKRWKNSNKKY